MRPISNTIVDDISVGSTWKPIEGGGTLSTTMGNITVIRIASGRVHYAYARSRGDAHFHVSKMHFLTYTERIR